MEWSDEAITLLRAFWDEGLSTAEIGRRMGISKNAVVGKAHRLNLAARPSPIRRDGVASRPSPGSRRSSAVTLPSMADPSIGDEPAAIAALSVPEKTVAVVADEAVIAVEAASVPVELASAPRSVPVSAALVEQAREPAEGSAPVVAAGNIAKEDKALPSVQPAAVATPSSPPAARPTPRAISKVASPAFPSGGRLVSCCWPIGEPGTKEFRFCDAPAMAGKPYCAEHAALAYVKVRDRRDDAA
ncbi:GcrA family cell cycle regulator [Granulibacter bethesdensis]|uniref:GcrA cell cycle regulator n=1 Tax=Granulibacter bethesdensis (strain ATCC BAA-1260 / CGDNIH1) TaxID=391165 RepID=Q0BPU2_GRABC|nr:GcrA family cell cycle regulator [Granulibacter bethesdensis]ABI63160.1 Hypothetical protein GbCGDNIH1_2262 [Granulibacter bethesdensis CGDNIH1]APH53038.1 Hypothetical protein GbCGDNIH5_2262 [Granulibacter bethesdensis]APH65727.1 Hypothetical protein GbCGDNIH1I4_2262 [Granulibacter bethesdensis]